MNEELKTQILEELGNLRKQINEKADRSTVEQILRYYQIKNKNFKNDFHSLPKNIPDPERICKECVENGELELAFMTAIRYFESILATKAEINEVSDKATRNYVESMFERLDIINRQQIKDSNLILRETIEEKLNNLSKEFDNISKSINERVFKCENDILYLQNFLINSKNNNNKNLNIKKNIKINENNIIIKKKKIPKFTSTQPNFPKNNEEFLNSSLIINKQNLC